ncbi:hypothetical protein N9891_00085 [bacterium]|nr:hypothetical protein [bacterium]
MEKPSLLVILDKGAMNNNSTKNRKGHIKTTTDSIYEKNLENVFETASRNEDQKDWGPYQFILENSDFLEYRKKRGESFIYRWYREKGPEGAKDIYQEFSLKYVGRKLNGPRSWTEGLWLSKLRFFKEDRRKSDNRLKRGGLSPHCPLDASTSFPLEDPQNSMLCGSGVTADELTEIWHKAELRLDPKALVTSHVTRRNLPDRLTPREALNILTEAEMETLVPRNGQQDCEWKRLVKNEFSRSRSRFNKVMSAVRDES